MVLAKPARLMLPNKNESEDDVKVAPKPKLQVGHHQIQQKKSKSNPHCSSWSSWSLPVAGQLRPSPTKLPDTTSQEVCPERGVGSLLNMPKVCKSCSHSDRSHISTGQISGWFGAEIILTKKNIGKQPEMVVFGDMWHLLFHPDLHQKSGFSQRYLTSCTNCTASSGTVRLRFGLIASQPSGFLLGEELASEIALEKKRLGKMAKWQLTACIFREVWGDRLRVFVGRIAFGS